MAIVLGIRQDVITRPRNSLCSTHSRLLRKAEPTRHFDYVEMECSKNQHGEGEQKRIEPLLSLIKNPLSTEIERLPR